MAGQTNDERIFGWILYYQNVYLIAPAGPRYEYKWCGSFRTAVPVDGPPLMDGANHPRRPNYVLYSSALPLKMCIAFSCWTITENRSTHWHALFLFLPPIKHAKISCLLYTARVTFTLLVILSNWFDVISSFIFFENWCAARRVIKCNSHRHAIHFHRIMSYHHMEIHKVTILFWAGGQQQAGISPAQQRNFFSRRLDEPAGSLELDTWATLARGHCEIHLPIFSYMHSLFVIKQQHLMHFKVIVIFFRQVIFAPTLMPFSNEYGIDLYIFPYMWWALSVLSLNNELLFVVAVYV